MKKRIYVVDDQDAVLETAVMVLRRMDPEWQVTGFSDPLKALEAIKAKAPDLILSDQVMPGMSGSQLLEQVRQLCPDTVRIVMSGYVPLNQLSVITAAHQYLAKPFEAVKLQESVRRSFAAQEKIVDKGLEAVVTSLRSIPSLPQVYHSLLKELEDSSTGMTAIARKVTQDAGLSAKVLQLANSPLFGHEATVTNPADAVMCLGTDMVAAVVLSQSLFRHYESLESGEMQLRQVWDHCWETGYFAQHLCLEKGLSRDVAEQAFLAGLLHEMGRFILIDNFPDKFKAACEGAHKANSPLGPHLREVFGTSPWQVTAYLLELWGMPAAVIAAISQQDNLTAQPGAPFNLGAALYVADHIVTRRCPPDSFPAEDWNNGYLQALGCAGEIPAWEKL